MIFNSKTSRSQDDYHFTNIQLEAIKRFLIAAGNDSNLPYIINIEIDISKEKLVQPHLPLRQVS